MPKKNQKNSLASSRLRCPIFSRHAELASLTRQLAPGDRGLTAARERWPAVDGQPARQERRDAGQHPSCTAGVLLLADILAHPQPRPHPTNAAHPPRGVADTLDGALPGRGRADVHRVRDRHAAPRRTHATDASTHRAGPVNQPDLYTTTLTCSTLCMHPTRIRTRRSIIGRRPVMEPSGLTHIRKVRDRISRCRSIRKERPALAPLGRCSCTGYYAPYTASCHSHRLRLFTPPPPIHTASCYSHHERRNTNTTTHNGSTPRPAAGRSSDYGSRSAHGSSHNPPHSFDTSMRTAPRGSPKSASSPPKPCQNRAAGSHNFGILQLRYTQRC